MKKTKKLLAFLLAMIMLLAMGMSAMAADQIVGTPDNTKGSIQITNAVKDQTYTVYKIFSATVSADGGAISYVATDAQIGLAGFSTYFDTDANKTVTIKDAGKDSEGNYLSAAAVAWIKENIETLAIGATVSGTKADEGGSLIFAGLDYGYYYIDSTNGSVVTVDSTTPTAQVIDKNPTPTLDKDITSVNGDKTAGADNETGATATAQIGDTISYTVTITAQKGAENYVFHDKLSSGLSLINNPTTDPILVQVDGEDPVAPRDYTITYGETHGDSDDITITFTKSYLDSITEPTDITITYKAVLNQNAVISGTGNKNSATLDYGHTPGTNTTPADEPRVYTYEFQLVKDNKEDVVLTGAKFKLFDAAEDGNEILVVKVKDGVYRVAKKGETGNEIEAGSPVIKGLAADNEYWLEETEAPAGYNKLTERIKIVVTGNVNEETDMANPTVSAGDNGSAGAVTATFKLDGTYDKGGVEVVNQKGVELPSTGGIGTTMFYVAGGALVLAAVVLLVTRKRMNSEK